MLWRPVEAVSAQQKLESVRLAIESSLDCRALNALRRSLSSVKGGRLLDNISCAAVTTLLISDDVRTAGDASAAAPHVSSGPTSRHQTRVPGLLHELRSHGVWERLHPQVQAVLSETTTKRVGTDPPPETHTTILLADALTLVSKVRSALSDAGYAVVSRDAPLVGPANLALDQFLKEWRRVSRDHTTGPRAFIAHSEVDISAPPGQLGGRCQHLTAMAAPDLATRSGDVLLAVATDGHDHVYGIGGAFSTSESLCWRASTADDVKTAISKYTSGSWHRRCGTLLPPLSSPLNLGDILVVANPGPRHRGLGR